MCSSYYHINKKVKQYNMNRVEIKTGDIRHSKTDELC
jgi:hypothetical protein